MPQFNGKQKFSAYQVLLFCTWHGGKASLRCPRNGQANEIPLGISVLSHIATGCLEQATGKAHRVVFASPDTGQQGEVTFIRCFVTSMHCRGRRWGHWLEFHMFSYFTSLKGGFFLCFLLCFLSISQAFEEPTLRPTVVSASRTEQIVTDVIAHTTVIGRDAIEQSQLIDLPSLLAREAGFQFTQNGGRGLQASAFLRGAASLQVLVLVDGVPMTKQDTTGAVSLEHIMLDQVDRVEIVRGNVSAIYGSGAIGGVIQVFTRDTQTGSNAFVSTETGSYGSKKAVAGTQGKVGDWLYALTAGNNSTRGRSAMNVAQGINVNPDNDGYRNDNYVVNLSYNLSPLHKLGFRSSGTYGRFDYDVSDAVFALPTDINKGSTLIQSNTLFWNAQVSPNWKSKINASDSSEKNTASTIGLYPFDSQAKTHTQLISWINEFALSQAVMTAGVDSQVQAVNTDDGYGTFLNKNRTANAVYAGMLYTLDADSFQLNVRHDSVENTGSKNTSYFGYARQLTPQWRVTVAHSTAFNVAPLGYLYDPTYGTPTLKPETATTQEIGLQWAAASHVLRATYFTTRTKDLLLYDMSTYRFANISSANNEGLEASYSGRLNTTDLRASLTLQKPVNEATGNILDRRAKTLASASASQLLGLWTLGSSLRFTGARPDTGSHPGLTSYWLLDTTARYRLSSDWVVYGRVENLTDKTYQTAYGYQQLPRTIYLGATWDFKH
jgi:vitamin B12 transporter